MPTLGDVLVVIKLVLLPAFNLLSMLTYTPLYESKERKSVCESGSLTIGSILKSLFCHCLSQEK